MDEFKKKKEEAGTTIEPTGEKEKELRDVPQDDILTIKNEIVTYELVFNAHNCSDENVKECFDYNFKDEVKRRKLNIEDPNL